MNEWQRMMDENTARVMREVLAQLEEMEEVERRRNAVRSWWRVRGIEVVI